MWNRGYYNFALVVRCECGEHALNLIMECALASGCSGGLADTAVVIVVVVVWL